MVGRSKIEFRNEISTEIGKARKFIFKNDFLRGLLHISIFFIPLLFFLLFIDIAFELNSVLRLFLLTIFSLLFLYFIYSKLIVAILKYFKVLRGYDDVSIARQLIADPLVEDKLLTYIELRNFCEANYLLENAISQKETEVRKFSFGNRLKVSKNTKTVKFLSIVFLLSMLSFFISDSIFQIAAIRFFNPTYVISYRLLHFELLNTSLEVTQNEDIELKVVIKGSYSPQQIYVRIGDKDLFAQRENDTIWRYSLAKVNQTLRFYFHDHTNQSPVYTLHVIDIPVLRGLHVQIIPPPHTNMSTFQVKGNGNFNFPQGSEIIWTFETGNTETIFLKFHADSMEGIKRRGTMEVRKKFTQSFDYEVRLYSGRIWNKEKYQFSGKSIYDEFPKITINVDDSREIPAPILVSGQIIDDYGFTNLRVVLVSTDTTFTLPVPFSKGLTNQKIYYQLYLYDLCQEYSISKLEYYFEVTDNDKVNNFKTTRSESYIFEIPDSEAINKKADEVTTGIMEKIVLGVALMKDLNMQQRDLERKLKTENLNQWEKNQIQEQISQNKADMNKLLNEVKNLNDKLKSLANLQKPNTENRKLLEKQLQIQELLEKLMDNELSEMFKELEKLKSELQDKRKDKDEKQLSMKSLEEMLERNLEMLKRFEIEKGVFTVSEKLEKLSEELNTTDSAEERENIEDAVNKEFEKHQELLEKNEKLKKPFELEKFEEEKGDLKKQFDKNNSKENRPEENKRNSKKLKELSEKMKSNMESNAQEQMVEDIENLKQIRSNLLIVSFTQEELVDSLKNMSNKLPAFNRLRLRQKEITDYWVFIKDSINSLITRNPMLGNMLAEDMNGIENMNSVILGHLLAEHPKPITVQQLKALSHYNTVLLFIDEAIQRAEEDMNSSGQGGGCPKPGKGKPSPGEMAKTQQGLKQKLKDLMDKMKQQKGEGQQGGESLSEQLGNYLSQQEQMQKMIGEMMNQGDMGQAAKELLKEINNLIDKNINDIVNKSVNNETILRQERIITRLLESDKAEQERKTEEKRESKESRKEFISEPIEMQNDSIKRTNFDETLKYRLLNLNKYYLDLYQNYLGNEK